MHSTLNSSLVVLVMVVQIHHLSKTSKTVHVGHGLSFLSWWFGLVVQKHWCSSLHHSMTQKLATWHEIKKCARKTAFLSSKTYIAEYVWEDIFKWHTDINKNICTNSLKAFQYFCALLLFLLVLIYSYYNYITYLYKYRH